LPCRENEQENIYKYIKKGLATNGSYSSLYISGMPGTGKTACVHAVIKKLRIEYQINNINEDLNNISVKRNTEIGRLVAKKTKSNLQIFEFYILKYKNLFFYLLIKIYFR